MRTIRDTHHTLRGGSALAPNIHWLPPSVTANSTLWPSTPLCTDSQSIRQSSVEERSVPPFPRHISATPRRHQHPLRRGQASLFYRTQVRTRSLFACSEGLVPCRTAVPGSARHRLPHCIYCRGSAAAANTLHQSVSGYHQRPAATGRLGQHNGNGNKPEEHETATCAGRESLRDRRLFVSGYSHGSRVLGYPEWRSSLRGKQKSAELP